MIFMIFTGKQPASLENEKNDEVSAMMKKDAAGNVHISFCFYISYMAGLRNVIEIKNVLSRLLIVQYVHYFAF